MKGERMAKRSSFGSMMRKRLSDITNSQSQPKLPALEENPCQISPSTEDYINQLIKEKMTLIKLIEDRNKIIELSGNELQNLRVSLQKLQLQNRNLAQSNSQFLAELNIGREKLKALQHELVCKDALLKAMNTEKQGKADMNCQKNDSKSKEGDEAAGEQLHKANNDDKPCNRNRRRAGRSQSMEPSTARRRDSEKEKFENKRPCLRRQSARFKSQEREPAENLFEIEAAKFTAKELLDTPMREDGPPLLVLSTTPTEETYEPSQGSSLGRPSRKAAEKVKSYKEIPLNVKMRRQE